MKYNIWYDPWVKWWDEWAVCIDFNNSLTITYQSIREHMYPYLEKWITNIFRINCNEVQSKKVEEIIKEYEKQDNIIN